MEAITVAKTAAVVVKNKNTIIKTIVIVVLAIAFPLLAISTSLLELVSAFTPEGTVPSTNEMDVTHTAVYDALKDATEPFYDDLWNEMGNKRAEIMAEHTEPITLYDDSGNPYDAERCDVIVSRHMNYFGDTYLLSYLVCMDGIDVNTTHINEQVAYDFLDSVCQMVVIEGNNEYEVTNQFLSIEEIIQMWFPDESKAKKFRIMCEAYSQFMEISDTSIDVEAGNWTNADFSSIVLIDVPLYLQYRGSWAGVAYGDGTISRTGCSPTCLAMVLSYLRQEQILPSDVAAWAGNRYYVNGVGTSWSIYGAVEQDWGVRCTSIGKNQSLLVQALREGKPVIASMGPGTFTRGGHFIVLSGITLDGKITVKDPNDNAIKNHANKGFDIGLIIRECKNLWVCE